MDDLSALREEYAMTIHPGKWTALLALATLAIGASGCVSSLQLQDFVRTEIARVLADVSGQLVQLFTTATQ